MSGFDPSWLALREAYDHKVRDLELTAAFLRALGPSPGLIDLGCGGGSNLRYLAPLLPSGQRWTCVDYDPALLRIVDDSKPRGIEVDTVCLDLADRLEALEVQLGTGITATALLDLASAAWLDRLAAFCGRSPVLMTLSYDGRMAWDPIDPLDEAITAAFNEHQRGDKGFGPSLGPDAGRYLAEQLRQGPTEVRLAKSDWVFAGDDRAILLAMLEGITGSAREIDPALPIDGWKMKRLAEIEAGALTMTVGHDDLLSLPG